MVGESHSREGSSLVSRGISLVEETLHRVLSPLESLKAIYSYWLIKALENRIMSNLISHLNNPNNVNSKIHGGMSRSRVLNHHPLTQWRNRCSSGTGLKGGQILGWGGGTVFWGSFWLLGWTGAQTRWGNFEELSQHSRSG